MLSSTSKEEKRIKWLEISLWFLCSAFASTYLNTAFLKEFHGDAYALTLVRFLGSSIFGFVANVFQIGNSKRLSLEEFFQVFFTFLLPAVCLLSANLFNSVSLDRGGITLTYVVKAGIPLVTVIICLLKGQLVSARLAATLIPTVIGVALSAWADTEFAWDGFIAAWISTIAQALLNVSSKTSIQSTGLSGQRSQFVLVTISSILMLIANVGLEFLDWEPIIEKVKKSEKSLAVLILVALAYHVEYVLNFIVTENVSEVHFSVLDVARRLAIILAGAAMFGKVLSGLNVFGVILALLGVLLFSRAKRFEMSSALAHPNNKVVIESSQQLEKKKS
jgi:hypothetical protein